MDAKSHLRALLFALLSDGVIIICSHNNLYAKRRHSVDDDIKNLSLNRRNSAPPVLDYDGGVVCLKPGLTLRLAALVVTTDMSLIGVSREI